MSWLKHWAKTIIPLASISYMAAIPLWGGLQYAAGIAAQSRAATLTPQEPGKGDAASIAGRLLTYEADVGGLTSGTKQRALANLYKAEQATEGLAAKSSSKAVRAELLFRRLDEWRRGASPALMSDSFSVALSLHSLSPLQTAALYLSTTAKAGLSGIIELSEKGVDVCAEVESGKLCWELFSYPETEGKKQFQLLNLGSQEVESLLKAVFASSLQLQDKAVIDSAFAAIPGAHEVALIKPLRFAGGLEAAIDHPSLLFAKYLPLSNQRLLDRLHKESRNPELLEWSKATGTSGLNPVVMWRAKREVHRFGWMNPILPLLSFAWQFYTPVEAISGARVNYDVDLFKSLVPGAGFGAIALSVFTVFIIRRKRQSQGGKEYHLRNA